MRVKRIAYKLISCIKYLLFITLSTFSLTAFAEYYVVYSVDCFRSGYYHSPWRHHHHAKKTHHHVKRNPYGMYVYDGCVCPSCSCRVVRIVHPCRSCGYIAPDRYGYYEYNYGYERDYDMRTGDDSGAELDIDR